MEKKTIGSFISVLRRANGMTQAELAEKLFVSDKTVSRWERDESTPDLTLLPIIADLFGITVDELLRGQRNSATPISLLEEDKEALLEREEQARKNDEKRIQRLLNKRYKKFKNLSVITLGVAFAGFFSALICTFVVRNSLLGGILACLFTITAVVLESCFTNSFLHIDDEDEPLSSTALRHNSKVVVYAKNCFLFLSSMLGLSIPLFFINKYSFRGYEGSNGGHLVFYAVLLSGVVFPLLAQLIYEAAIKKKLVNGSLLSSVSYTPLADKKRKLFFSMSVPCLLISLILLIAQVFVWDWVDPQELIKPTKFDTLEELIDYMERTDAPDDIICDKPCPDGETTFFVHPKWNAYTHIGCVAPVGEWHAVRDGDGKIIATFFWSNASVYSYRTAFNRYTVCEYSECERAQTLYNSIDNGLFVLAVANVATFVIVYNIKKKKIK